MFRAKMTYVCLAIVVAISLAAVSPALATITVVRDYTFNDNTTPTGFTTYGAPTYSNGSLQLDGSSAIGIATPLTATDNFGIEAIVTASAFTTGDTPMNWVVTNGDGAGHGAGLWHYTMTDPAWGWQGVLMGVGNFGSSSIGTGTQVRLAVACQSGITTFYVNGVATGTRYDAPNFGAGASLFMVGASDSSLSNAFKGSVNEVRLFTFGAGSFNAGTDLLTSTTVPEPSTLVLSGLGLFGLLAYAWRKRK